MREISGLPGLSCNVRVDIEPQVWECSKSTETCFSVSLWWPFLIQGVQVLKFAFGSVPTPLPKKPIIKMEENEV